VELADRRCEIGAPAGRRGVLRSTTPKLPGGSWTDSERGSGPVVANQVVYVNKADSDFLGSSLYAVDADTGDRLWSWAAPSHVYQAPAIAGGSVYVDDFTSHAGVIKLSLPPRQ